MDVTVIIPSYNRASVLNRCINSLLNQTKNPSEIIIVDDYSTDNTKTLFQEHYEDDVEYIRHDTNRGVAAARNTGIEQSKHDYILFLDSDDELDPASIEKMCDVFKENPNICGIHTHYEIVNKSGQRSTTWEETSGIVTRDDLLERNAVHGIGGTMYKASTLRDIGGFDESMPKAEDVDLSIRAANFGDLFVIDEILLTVHTDGGGQLTENYDAIYSGERTFLEKYGDDISDNYQIGCHLRAGMAAVHLDRTGSAKDHFTKAISCTTTGRKRAHVLQRIGRYYRNAGYMSEANSMLWESIKCNWKDTATWSYWIASSLGERGWSTARRIKNNI